MKIVRLDDAQVTMTVSPLKHPDGEKISYMRWDWLGLELQFVQLQHPVIVDEKKTYIRYQGIDLVYWYEILHPAEIWDELTNLLLEYDLICAPINAVVQSYSLPTMEDPCQP